MLMTLGMLRHQLAVDYELPKFARHFFNRLVQQQSLDWFDPRLAPGRIYEATARLGRAVEFVEFFEVQQPLLASLTGSYWTARRSLQVLRRWAIRLGLAVLAVGAMLYFVLVDPHDARSILPAAIPFEWVHPALLIILILLILALIGVLRKMTGGGDRGTLPAG